MKICILTPRFPFPENGGDVLRINSIARHLKNNGHTVILISLYAGDDICNRYKYNYCDRLYDKIYYIKFTKLESFINSLIAFFLNRPIQVGYYFNLRYLATLNKIKKYDNPDLYIAQLLRMVPYTNLLHIQDKTIVDMADALSKTYGMIKLSGRASLKKIIYRIEKKRIAAYEQSAITQYKKCVLNALDDKVFLGNHDSLYVYPMGVQCLDNLVPLYNKNKIVFVGNMRTLQNQDAVLFFINDILPIIKRTVPAAVFYIIGAEPPPFIQNIADGKNIIVSNFVDSIEDAIKDAACSVAPVRIAAGIQNKVLISMACGIPVVLTSLIAKGIPELTPHQNCLIADEQHDFAQSVISLMQNSILRNNIGKKSHALMRSNYSWNAILRGYEELS
jgi:glycosyltransferase involved in cell wall biosynthesis